MIRIGLTGGIGSGKSTVSSILKERGIPIVDADIISRDVLKEYPQILKEVKSIFGEDFFDENGIFKRKEFGNFIFQSDDKRKRYESIIMPFIKGEIFNKINNLEEDYKDICVLDAPTLIENGLHKYMDINVLVWVDKQTQINRVKKRDDLTEEQITSRINSQMSLDKKKRYADFVLNNSNSLDETKKQLEEMLEQISKDYRGVKCLKR